MRSVGLITEYNPFHSGHLYHLEQSKRTSQAEVAVAVMSGHFLQRGEPALCDKWRRAEMALSAGVDIVIELPLPWACSSAPDFARGAVQSLSALGGVDALCFGSESGTLAPLQDCASLLCEKADEIAARSARMLREGLNYPQARTRLLTELLPDSAKLISRPNNILGIEYLKALLQLNSSITPHTIERIGAGYHDTDIDVSNIASATGIRQRLAQGQSIDGLMPPEVARLLEAAVGQGQFLSQERYGAMLLGQIMRAPQQLPALWLVQDGIENRLLAAAEESGTLVELVDRVKSRQLTRTRIQRMMISVLLGLEKSVADDLLEVGPRYLHLLGVSEAGRKFLARGRKERNLPLVQNFSRVHTQLRRYYGAGSQEHRLALRQLDLELRASKIYTLLLQCWDGKSRNRDFYTDLIRK